MVDKITYEDKELLQNDESIPRKNKVTAKDLNEIKEVVNNHAENMNTKQDKEEGKGLTSNDFTNEYKEKLESLENYNDTEIKESMSNLQNEDITIRNDMKSLQNKDKEIIEQLKTKVDKIGGKNLSQNDFTNTFKEKLEGLENYDDTNIKTRITTLETDNTENKKEIENIKQTNIQQEEMIQTNADSINEVKGKTLKQDEIIKTNTDDIEAIKEENAELKAECERLKEDLRYLPMIAGSGENVMLKDTAEARFKDFGIGGNTIQEGEPSLESSAEIKNVKDRVNVTVCNKNLSILPFFHTSVNTTEIGYVKKGVTYTLSFNVIPTIGYNIRYLISKEVIDTKQRTTGKQEIVFTATQDDYIYINGWEISEVNNEYYENIQLEEGEIATEYEEHKEQNFQFPLKEGQVLHKTDYLAEDGIHHKRKTIVAEGINYKTTYVFLSGWFQLKNMMSNELVIVGNPCKDWNVAEYISCNKLSCISQADIQQKGYKGIAVSPNGNISIKFDNAVEENVWTVEKVNNYLAENKLMIEYILPEEEKEAYTDEQRKAYKQIKNTAKSYNGTTHIYSTDETSPNFEVEARKDMQVENNKLQTQIDEIRELISTTETSAMLLDNMQKDLEKEVM